MVSCIVPALLGRKPACGIAAIRAKALCRGACRGTGRGVAQPGSAPVWGTGGRRFKSCRPDQFPSPAIFLHSDEQSARARLHLLHRDARHAGAGRDASGAARHRAGLHGRRHCRRRRDVRPFRNGLGADAGPVLAPARRPLGSLRPSAGDPDFLPGPRPRLHLHGAGPVAPAAVHRPRDLGHHGGHHQHRLRLHRRRDDDRKPRQGLRPPWRSSESAAPSSRGFWSGRWSHGSARGAPCSPAS